MALWEYIGAWSGTTKLLLHLNWNANDSSWNWNNWTAINVSWVGGRLWSGAASLNWTSWYITIPDNASLDFWTWNFTVSFWLKLNNTNTWQYIINKWNNTWPNNWWIIQTDWSDWTKCTFYSFDWWASSLTSWTWFFEANKWIRYVFVRNSTWIFMYKNWVLFSSNTSTARNMNNPFPLLIWQVQNWQWTNWTIDEVILENRWWTTQEIIKDYTFSKWLYWII